MPTVFVALILAVFALFSPLQGASTAAAHEPASTPSSTLLKHYVRGGIVVINQDTLATRFIPYRLARELDRRSPVRASA